MQRARRRVGLRLVGVFFGGVAFTAGMAVGRAATPDSVTEGPGRFASSGTSWELVLRKVWRTGREQIAKFKLTTPHGERLFQSRVVPETSGGSDEVQSVLTVARDITEISCAEAERERLPAELVERERRHVQLLERLASAQQEENRRLAAAQALQQLGAREREILQLIAQGWTNAAIGRELHARPIER
jgi:DNA-binding CsgD family transcriptional regulator